MVDFFKKMSIIIFIMIINMAVMAQQKRKEIHFLADTLNVDVKNRIVEIGKEGEIPYYAFYCKCISPYDAVVSFTYSKRDSSVNIKDIIPDYNFMTWKDFSDIISKEGNHLNKVYSIYITEVLPGNKYKTNKVDLVLRKPPIVDYQIIKSPNN